MREEEDRRKEGGEKREKRRDGRKFFRIPHTQNEDLKNVNF